MSGYQLHIAYDTKYIWLLGQDRRSRRTRIQPEIKDKKPKSSYTLYQECGFLYLILGGREIGAATKPRAQRTSPSKVGPYQ
eukprot:845070-Rhodomonas_salina.1